MEELQLLLKLRRGDLEAFEMILSQYERGIFGYLCRLTGNRADAEDLTQEVFLKLYQKRKTVDPDKNFKSWLFTIATNAARDRFRASGKAGMELAEEDAAETISDGFSYYSVEAASDIESALARLKPAHRSALMLFYREGFGYEEIAEMLAIPVNTVKTHLRRGKESLRKYLENDYG